MSNLNLAIVSLEHMHAWSYAEAFDRVAGATLVAIADTDPDRLNKARQTCTKVKSFYGDYQQLLEDSDVDGVIICSSNDKHRQIAVQAAKHKKHIMCEKPLALTVADCEEIIKAAENAGVVLMTAFPVRFSPAVQEARRRIQSGELGAILGASTTNHGSMPGGWFVEKDKSGGGAVIDHTVHVADAMRWILDDEIDTVYAEFGRRLHQLDVEDVGQLVMRFKKGSVVSLDTSWSRPKSYSIWGDVKIAIKGEKGNITLNCFPQQINHYDDTAMKHSGFNMGEDLDQLMVQEFTNAIREKRQPLVTGLDGLRAVEAALAAYSAGENAEAVSVIS